MGNRIASFEARSSVQSLDTVGGFAELSQIGPMVAGTISNGGGLAFARLDDELTNLSYVDGTDIRAYRVDGLHASGSSSAWALYTVEEGVSIQTCLGEFHFSGSGLISSLPEEEHCFEGIPSDTPSRVVGNHGNLLHVLLARSERSIAVSFDTSLGQVTHAMDVTPKGDCALSGDRVVCSGIDQQGRVRVVSKDFSSSSRATESIIPNTSGNYNSVQIACGEDSDCLLAISGDYNHQARRQEMYTVRFSLDDMQVSRSWLGRFPTDSEYSGISCVGSASAMQCYLDNSMGLSAAMTINSLGQLASVVESSLPMKMSQSDQNVFTGGIDGYASVAFGQASSSCGFGESLQPTHTYGQARFLPSIDPTSTQTVTPRTFEGELGEIKDRSVFDPCDPPTDTNAPTGQATSGSTGDTATPTPGGTGGTVSPTPGSTGGTVSPTPSSTGSTVTPTPLDTLHTQLETAGFTGPAVPTLPHTHPPTEAPSDGNGSPPQASHTGLKITGLVLVYAMLQWFFQYNRFSWVSQGKKQAIGEGSWARYNYLLENSVLSRDFLSGAINTCEGIRQAREAFERKLFFSELVADADGVLTEDDNATITRRVADKKDRSLGALEVRREERAIIDDEVRVAVTNQQMKDGMVAQANASMLGNLALGRLPIVRLGRGMGLVHQFTELLRFPQLLIASVARWGGKKIKASDREAIVADAYAQICFILANTLKDEDIDTSARQSLLNLALELEAMAVGFKGLAAGNFETVHQANTVIREVDTNASEDALARLRVLFLGKPLEQPRIEEPRIEEQRQLRRLFRLVDKHVRQTRNQYAAYVNRSKLLGRHFGKHVPPKEERAFLDARGKHVGDIEAERDAVVVLDVSDDDVDDRPRSVALQIQENNGDDAQPQLDESLSSVAREQEDGGDDAQPPPPVYDDRLFEPLERFLQGDSVALWDKSALAAIVATKRRISDEPLMNREVLLSAYEGLTDDPSTGVTIWEQAGVLPLLEAGITAFDDGEYGEAIRLFSTAGKIVHAVEDQLSKENSDVAKEMEKNPGQQPKESMAQRVRICAMLLVTYKKLRIEINSLVGLARIKHAQENQGLDDDAQALSERERELEDLGFDEEERATILRGEEGCVLTAEALERARRALEALKDAPNDDDEDAVGEAENRVRECMQHAVQVFRNNREAIRDGSRCVANRIHQVAGTAPSDASKIKKEVMDGFQQFRKECGLIDAADGQWDTGVLHDIQQALNGNDDVARNVGHEHDGAHSATQSFQELENLFTEGMEGDSNFLELMRQDRARVRAATSPGGAFGFLARVVGSAPAARNADPRPRPAAQAEAAVQAEEGGMAAPLLGQQAQQDARQGRDWCCCFPSGRHAGRRGPAVIDDVVSDSEQSVGSEQSASSSS